VTLLDGHRVAAIDDAADSALACYLRSLGARLERVPLADVHDALANADVLIERMGAHALAEIGVAPEQLALRHPRLVHVSVTPFGNVGPRARWRGSELVASAMGGTLRCTGDPDRAPVKEALDACWFHADMVAAAGAMAALHERGVSGRGQSVDVSVQEVAFARNVSGVLAWQFDRRKLQRTGGALNYGRAVVRCIWPLADGYCFHSLMTGRFGAPANRALSDWMDETGADNPLRGVDWLRYDRSALEPHTRARWEGAIERFFRTLTRAELAGEGRRRGINAEIVAAPGDVLAEPHLQARGFWQLDGVGSRAPGRFVNITPAVNAGAPPRELRTTARSGPLAGVRVLDFSWALVGSITTKVLGDLGCEVVKLESRTRPCLSRIDVQVSASRADSFDDKPWFAHLNSSKQSVALDLKQPESRELLEPLIDWADVVVENFSPGTMHKLGLDYERLAARNPGLVMISGSVFGQTGPLAREWGVDGTGAALSGRTLLTGWPDRPPVIPSAVPYGDVVMPYVMAASVAAALARRRELGRGCHIDSSMYEICVQQMAAAVTAADRGTPLERQGNRDPRVFHQGVYAASGEDRWVAITLFDHDEWSALRAHESIASADTPQQRDAALAQWLRTRVDRDAVERLQALGIAAGVVQDMQDLLEGDPGIAARGALVELDHPALGRFGHLRTPVTFSRSAVAPFRAPALGEHTHAIAIELCKLAPARVTELESQGVLR
jgi:crotonobetainyl-CoA:carnitine CoA-transferase CaiB-like acyl-CoA transferase